MSETKLSLEQLEADSKKLREPATCNAGHKSNLPLALWDCPVCTQLLRDKLQQVKDGARELAEGVIANTFPGSYWQEVVDKAHRFKAALGGKADIDLEAHERDLEHQSDCGEG